MSRFILRRLAETLLVLLAMSIVVYGLIGLMPGDPIDLMIAADPTLTTADAARLKALYGLDRPLIERYLAWLAAAAQGDLGYSRLMARPVLDVLGPRLGNTLLLLGASFALALLLAIPAGVWAALRPRSLRDNVLSVVAFAGISVPSFWLAILLIILFAVTLGVLPASGTATIGVDSLADRAKYLIMPVLTLTLVSAGVYLRYTRAAMIEVLRQDFVRTALAKGVSPARLVFGHALRNAMIPVVTIMALDFGNLFSGALIVETMFAYLGMGKTIFDAIMGNDYNLAMAGLLLATATVLLANLAADLAYGWLDP
ncbi:MAG: ABC transporter permease, partial [Dongiaceae bacterium]